MDNDLKKFISIIGQRFDKFEERLDILEFKIDRVYKSLNDLDLKVFMLKNDIRK